MSGIISQRYLQLQPGSQDDFGAGLNGGGAIFEFIFFLHQYSIRGEHSSHSSPNGGNHSTGDCPGFPRSIKR